MAPRTSARSRIDQELEDRRGRPLIADGTRRVVRMVRDDGTEWHVDVGESEDDEHARLHAEAMSDDNGGGWKFDAVVDRFPHEQADEAETQ